MFIATLHCPPKADLDLCQAPTYLELLELLQRTGPNTVSACLQDYKMSYDGLTSASIEITFKD